MANIFNDTQLRLILDAHDKLQREGKDLTEYDSLVSREEFSRFQESLSRSNYPPAHQGSSQGPRSRKISERSGERYPYQQFHSTWNYTPSSFAPQGPSGTGDMAIKTEPDQQPMLDTIPYTSPADASMSREAWAPNEEGASNSEEMAFPEFPLGSDPQREENQVTSTDSFHAGHQVSNAPQGGSMWTLTNTFPADSHHSNNLASASSAFVPDNQPLFANLPHNAGASTIYSYHSWSLSQISPTTANSQAYAPPVSFPQTSFPVPFTQLAPMTSGHQQMPTSLPPVVANFTQGTVVPTDANQMISSMLPVPINHQSSYYSQFPSNPSSGASSQTGVTRTARARPRQRSTPIGNAGPTQTGVIRTARAPRRQRSTPIGNPGSTQSGVIPTARATRRQRPTPAGYPGPTWLKYLKDGSVLCQWEKCRDRSFTSVDAFKTHCKTHLSGSSDPVAQCKWRGCLRSDDMTSLRRHVLSDHGKVLYLCPGRCGRKPTTRPDPHHICPTA